MAAKQLKASIIIDLTGNVLAKSREFGSAISGMSKKNSASLMSFGRSVKSASNEIDRLGNRAIVSATALGYGFNKTFIKTASMFEQYRKQTAALFGGPESGKKAMDWAKQNAKDTVLSLEQVMDLMTTMKGFGMDPMDGKLKTMENVAARNGWDYDKLSGAQMQINQMYAKGKIGMDDAKLLMGYGINVYQEIATATGHSLKQVMAAGSKGLLGKKALGIFFKQLDSESKGASAAAMNAWSGMVSNLDDDWQQFEENVMSRGVFDKLKGKLRKIKALVEDPSGSNSAAHNTAATLNHIIDEADKGAQGLWAALKGVGGALDYISKHVGGMKNLAEIMAGIYIANKAIRVGGSVAKVGYSIGKPVAKVGYSAVKGTYKGLRWVGRKLRGKKNRPSVGSTVGGDVPGLESALGVQKVFVTNWPAGMRGGGMGLDDLGDGKDKKGKGRRKKGPGKGRGRFSRIINAGEEVVADVAKPGMWKKMKSVLGIAGKGVGSVAKGAVKTVPYVGTAIALGTTAVDIANSESKSDIGGAVGSAVGMVVGGALGSLTDVVTGPFGTVIGATVGQTVGEKIGQYIGSWFEDDKKDKDAKEAETKGKIDLNINLPAGASVGSSYMSFGGASPVNLLTGGYIP